MPHGHCKFSNEFAVAGFIFWNTFTPKRLRSLKSANHAILIRMIDHYSLYEINNLTDRFGLTDGVPKGVKPRYNVSPTNAAAVITRSGETTELSMMSWGLVSSGAKDSNSVFRYKTFNIMSEKVFSKPSWDSAIRTQRCIIPVNGFYMVRSGDAGEAYYFGMDNQPLMAVAGIYTSGANPDDPSSRTFSMLTIESTDAMPLPFARMPALLRPENEKLWMDPTAGDLSSILQAMRPLDTKKLAYRKVSRDMISAKSDSPSLIEHLK